MLVWEDAMTTGQANIDAQHKWLIDNFNALLDALGEAHEYEQLGKMLDSVQFYAKWHFEREEQCMEDHACPVADRNKSAHDDFVNQFQRLYDDYHTSQMSNEVMQASINELAEWFMNHIRKIDTQLSHCPVRPAE